MTNLAPSYDRCSRPHRTPIDLPADQRGDFISERYGGTVPVLWSTGDIAQLAGVIDASVNDWISRNRTVTPAMVSRRGMTYWSEEDARKIADGFIKRRELREERATFPKTKKGGIRWHLLDEETRARHGKPPIPVKEPLRPVRPSRSKAALEAKAQGKPVPLVKRGAERKLRSPDPQPAPKINSRTPRPRPVREPMPKTKPQPTPTQIEDAARAERAFQFLLSKQAS